MKESVRKFLGRILIISGLLCLLGMPILVLVSIPAHFYATNLLGLGYFGLPLLVIMAGIYCYKDNPQKVTQLLVISGIGFLIVYFGISGIILSVVYLWLAYLFWKESSQRNKIEMDNI